MSSSPPAWSQKPLSLIATPRYISNTPSMDIYTLTATQMALVHNSFIRAYNHVYHLASKVPPDDYHNFISYSLAIYTTLVQHHDGEEKHFFPLVEEGAGVVGLMDENVKQHGDFEAAHEAYGDYLQSLITGNTTARFSPARLRALIEAFAPALSQHLKDEIETLLALKQYPALDLEKVVKEVHARSMKDQSMLVGVPILMLNHDRTYEGGIHGMFPELPAPISWALRKLLPCWHWGWWKYASCDSDQMPRM